MAKKKHKPIVREEAEQPKAEESKPQTRKPRFVNKIINGVGVGTYE